jgi:conjugative relaxase-like TrwC/TraI family protein
MLSIGVMAGGQGHYYQALAREDYYLNGGEPMGKWFGKGAEHFGLADKKVTAKDLESLLDGLSPAGVPLVQNAKGDANQKRRPGFDLTFSAPKTVSAWWATASPEERKEIQAAQDVAVKAALVYMEQTATFTRTGKGGVNLHRAGFAAALFEHGTSRAMDPQLHTHALLMNFGVMADGRTRALVHPEFFARKMTAGALYRVELAAELQRRFGVEIEQDPHAYKKGGLGFKVVGISDQLCDFWSKRRAAIEKQLGEWGVESAAAAASAAKTTRVVKEIVPPRGELFDRWRGEAKSLGFVPLVMGAFRGNKDRDPSAAFDAALAKTLRELTAAPESRLEAKTVGGRMVTKIVDAFLGGENERAFGLSHFNESLLLRRLGENCQGKGIDVRTLLDKFAHAIEHSPSLLRLSNQRIHRQADRPSRAADDHRAHWRLAKEARRWTAPCRGSDLHRVVRILGTPEIFHQEGVRRTPPICRGSEPRRPLSSG